MAQNRIVGCQGKGEEEGESRFWAVLRAQHAKYKLAEEPGFPWRAFLGEAAETLHLDILLMKPQVPESTAFALLVLHGNKKVGGGAVGHILQLV